MPCACGADDVEVYLCRDVFRKIRIQMIDDTPGNSKTHRPGGTARTGDLPVRNLGAGQGTDVAAGLLAQEHGSDEGRAADVRHLSGPEDSSTLAPGSREPSRCNREPPDPRARFEEVHPHESIPATIEATPMFDAYREQILDIRSNTKESSFRIPRGLCESLEFEMAKPQNDTVMACLLDRSPISIVSKPSITSKRHTCLPHVDSSISPPRSHVGET